MPARSLTERVEILEQKVDALQMLPDRVSSLESQILQLRGEMHDGFSAIVVRLDALEGHAAGAEGRMDRMDQRFEQIDRRFEQVERLIQEGDEETRRYMRVLHEEVLTRLTLLDEARGRRKR